MGFLSSLLDIVGFGIGIPFGLLVGFFLFVYSQPKDVQDPDVRPLSELDSSTLMDLLPELPFWVKNPNYDRDWLNKFILNMWPYLDKAVSMYRQFVTQLEAWHSPYLLNTLGCIRLKQLSLEKLSLGTLPPILHGIKVYETNEKELAMEPAIKWAGNPNIILVLKMVAFPNYNSGQKSLNTILNSRMCLVDLQIFAAPRITLKPLVPTFPCFASLVLSLMERPHVDFGLKILGGDIMSIPGLIGLFRCCIDKLYWEIRMLKLTVKAPLEPKWIISTQLGIGHYITLTNDCGNFQETIKREVAKLYLWPQTLEIPILDAATGAIKKPVGILHVKVVRALKLLKMDFLGASDPYVKLSLSGERLPAKKTTVKRKNLNPEWNEKFKLIVRDPQAQVLQLYVYDWDKVGAHDKLGMQLVPLKLLTPHETQEFTLDLFKNTNLSDPQQKQRGLLLVTIQGAEDVEGQRHNNPYAMMKKTRDPQWNEEFQFMLEEPPLSEKIHIQVISQRSGIGFRSKESMGHVDIDLTDVVHNGRINHKYHLINSKNGQIHLEIKWKMI
ncbi:Synaptotagmin-3 [Vitis vinifera]|uniref:Synaptotagmin-3 n=1 Tax=Vitis vinifera TaxID=29760 RepID=A0A438D9I8_VITVI|nr:Synaptotagmin-3 [Vitis vinifera]